MSVAVVLVIALAVSGYLLWPMPPPPPDPNRCDAGVSKLDGECVGVTDGSFIFDEQLRSVEEKIKTENKKAEASGKYVTVAYLGQLTATPTSVPITRVRALLEGVYIAQRAANKADRQQKIRLVLANEGSLEQAWEPVTRQLAGMIDANDHLVAVVGLGVSSKPTAQSVKAMSEPGPKLPMIGMVITADGLNATGAGLAETTGVAGPIPGLFRVNSSVADQITVLGDYLRDKHRKAILVSDTNSSDLYTSTLRKDFIANKTMVAYWESGGRIELPYDGTAPIDVQFKNIVSNFCASSQPPDLVFYAGRGPLLLDFVKRLRSLPCENRSTPITVVTGSDGTALRNIRPEEQQATAAKVSVIYTALADPQMLGDPQLNPDVAQYQQFHTAFGDDTQFNDKDLADGWAIMAHDAMLAAADAIGEAGQTTTLPTRDTIRAVLRLMSSKVTSIQGAAGTFTFNSNTGDVVGRRLPIVKFGADGRFEVLHVAK